MHSLDLFAQNYFSLVRTSELTEYMYLLTILFDFSVQFVLVSFCIAGLIRIVRGIRYAFLFMFSLSSAGVIIYFLKLFFDVARPAGGVMSAFGQSFPSGHATIVTVFFIMLMYIFDDFLSSVWRIIFNSACIGMIIFVSFSRIYLGVHWLSDVIGGLCLGSVISYLSVAVFNFRNISRKDTSMIK
jgi:undecaprenyl-diphosphatase